MKKSWRPHAEHILENIRLLERIQQRGDIFSDDILYAATLRTLQTLTEATQHIPPELKAHHPEIPWKRISGFRNILVHDYLGDLDSAAVEEVIRRHIPALGVAVAALLEIPPEK